MVVLDIGFVFTLQAPVGAIRLLKKNDDANSLFPPQNTANKVYTHLHSSFFAIFIV